MNDIHAMHEELRQNLNELYAANDDLEAAKSEYEAELAKWMQTNPVAQRYAAAKEWLTSAQTAVIELRKEAHEMIGAEEPPVDLPDGFTAVERRHVDLLFSGDNETEPIVFEKCLRFAPFLLAIEKGRLTRIIRTYADEQGNLPHYLSFLTPYVRVRKQWELVIDDRAVVAATVTTTEPTDDLSDNTAQAAAD